MTDTPNSGTVSLSRKKLEYLIAHLLDGEMLEGAPPNPDTILEELREILAQPAEQQDEPVEYQYRERPCWVEGNLFSPWAPCDKGFHDSVLRDPLKLNFQRETRALYRRPAAQAVKLPDVDQLAQIIRQVDGNHSLGAGALAEKIFELLNAGAAKAVKLPERHNLPHREEFESADQYAASVEQTNTWNACLDEVAKLNGIAP